MSTVEFLRHF